MLFFRNWTKLVNVNFVETEHMLAKKKGVPGLGLLLSVLLCTSLHGPPVWATQWSEIGPFGGPVRAIHFSPLVKNLVYAVTPVDGIFVSTNDGATWSAQNNGLPITDTDLIQRSMIDVVFDPVDPAVVYTFNQRTLYKLNPATQQWAALYTVPNGDTGGGPIEGMAIDPFNPQHILLTGLFVYNVVGDTDYFTYLAETTDGGTTWIYNPNLHFITNHIEFSPTTPDIVFAGDQISTDNGNSWSFFLPGYSYNFGISPSNTNRVYALDNEPDNGFSTVVHRSDDGGKTWNIILGIPDLSSGTIYVDPRNADIVYVPVCTDPIHQDVIYKTTDGGITWTAVPIQFPGCFTTLAIDPDYDTHVLAGQYDLYSSWDQGQSFVLSDTGLAGRSISAVSVDSGSAPTLYMGEDEGSVGGQIFRSMDAGAHWQLFDSGRGLFKTGEPTSGAPVLNMDMDWFNRGYVYTGSLSSIDILTPGADSWVSTPTQDYGYTRVSASPLSPGVIYDTFDSGCGGFCDVYVLKSSNYGASWQIVSDDVLSLDYQPLMTQSYLTPNLIYRTEQYQVWKSADGGQTWSLLPAYIPTEYSGAVLAFTTSALSDSVLFATQCDWISRSGDDGASWQNVYVPTSLCTINTVYSDPAVPGTVYGGTNAGLVVSTDNGFTWTTSSVPGLANHSVRTIEHPTWNPGYMYAGTDDASGFVLGTPPDLTTAITGAGPLISNGTPSPYDITVTNAGVVAASPAALDIVPPANTTLAIVNPNGATCTPELSGSPGETVCDMPSLSAGGTWTVSVTVTPTGFLSGALMANAGSGQGDLDWSNNESAQIMYTSATDMAVGITPASSSVLVHSSGPLFTVTVANNGPTTDSANLSISYSPTGQNVTPTVTVPGCMQVPDGYTCTLNAFPVGTPITIPFTGSVPSVGPFAVAASVSSATTTDPDSSNNSASVVINVVPPAPITTDGSVTTEENTTVTGQLTATGMGPLTFKVIMQPKDGAIRITNTNTGAFTYSPTSGFSGSDSFTFTASNTGGASNVATESITVQAVSSSPPPTRGGSSGGGGLGLPMLSVFLVFVVKKSRWKRLYHTNPPYDPGCFRVAARFG
jgi:photosystem II stability/assembly factor-like uncharacterized protein